MTNHTPVEDLGRMTARLFIRAVHEACLVEQIIDNYLKICNEYGTRLGVRPRKLADIDLRRVEFELLAFGGYVLSGSLWRNLGVFQKKYSQPGHDRRYLDYFAAELADYLGILGTDQLKEVVVAQIVPQITFSKGLPLDVFRRFEQYGKLSGNDGSDLLRFFGRSLGQALDPKNYMLFDVMGAVFAERLIDIAHWAFETALEEA